MLNSRFIPLFLSGFLCFAIHSHLASSQGNPGPVVIATVNGENITADDLLVELERIHASQQTTSRSGFDLDKVVNKLINDRLLIQDARLLQLDQEPEFQKQVAAFKRTAAAEQFRRDAVPDTFAVSEAEIKDYYDQNFLQLRLFVLTLRDRRQADSLAQAVLGSHLQAVAPSFAQDLYRFGGGDLGLKRLQELDPAFRENAQAMKVGEIRGPFANRSAFSLIELLEEKPPDSAQFAPHKMRIKAILNQQKRRACQDSLIQKLKVDCPVTVNDSLLQAVLSIPDSAFNVLNRPDATIVQIGDQRISAASLERRLLVKGGVSDPNMLRAMIRTSLDELIADHLFQNKAVTLDYPGKPGVLRRIVVFQDSLLLINYLEQVLWPQVHVRPEAVDSLYQANRERYRLPDDVRFSQITVASQDSAAQLLERLRSGADFAWMAQERSSDDYAAKGGDRGWLNLSTLPELLRTELDTSAVGRIIGPFPGEDGYFILKITDRKVGALQDLSVVRGQIQQQLSRMEFTRILDRVLAQLKADADVVIHREQLDHLVIGGKER